jgi:hypothetical protein
MLPLLTSDWFILSLTDYLTDFEICNLLVLNKVITVKKYKIKKISGKIACELKMFYPTKIILDDLIMENKLEIRK